MKLAECNASGECATAGHPQRASVKEQHVAAMKWRPENTL